MGKRKQLPQFKPYERELAARGFKRVIGIDEVGRGCLAGPVVVAAVCLPLDYTIEGLADSKLLTERQREHLYFEHLLSLDVSVAELPAEVIDEINILNATKTAMQHAALAWEQYYGGLDYVLADAVKLKFHVPWEAFEKGDRDYASIAAASVVAKVHRDHLMQRLHRYYPEYGFDRHKGYGTPQHLAAIEKHGVIKGLHRLSFAPCQNKLG